MESIKVDWYLQRQGHPETVYHLNLMLGSKERLTVGRNVGDNIDIVCDGKTVSRKHCELKFCEDSWKIVDMGSMNGIFINQKKIPSRKPVTLKVGDVLGIGAIENSQPQYFIFDVLKSVVKNEDQIGAKSTTSSLLSQTTTKVPGTPGSQLKNASSVSNSSRKRISSSQTATKSLSPVCGQPATKNVNPSKSTKIRYKNFPVVVSRELMEDIKLKQSCVVVLKPLRNYDPLVRRKRTRVFQLSESDSEVDIHGKTKSVSDPTANDHTTQNSSSIGLNLSKNVTEKISDSKHEVTLDIGSSSDSDIAEEGIPVQNAKPKSRFVIEKISFTTEGRIVDRKDSSLANESEADLPNSQAYSQFVDLEEESGDIEASQSVLASSSSQNQENAARQTASWEDDDVIILDSDEEIFTSQPRVKTEPLDDIDGEGRSFPKVNENLQDCATPYSSEPRSLRCDSVSSDDEYPPIPASTCSTNQTETAQGQGEKRRAVVDNIQVQQPDPELPTLPVVNGAEQTTKALPDGTASSSVAKKTAFAKSGPLRMAKEIPMRPMQPRRKQKKKTSRREAMQNEQDLTSHTVSVNQAFAGKNKTGKRTEPDVSVESVPVYGLGRTSDKTAVTEKLERALPKAVKAKVTKKSRVDMYIEDVVSREQPVAAEAQKRSISGSESDTRNAKRQRTDECCFPDELANLGGIEEKQDPLDELDISESLANLPTPQFKKPVVRIARTPNELSRKPPVGRSASSELHVSSIPGTAVVKANSRLRDPRTDARPLGRTENFNAPRSSAGSVTAVSSPVLNPAPVSRDLTSSSLATVSRINQDDGPFRNPSPEKSLQLTQEKRASEAPKKSSNVAVVEAGVGFGDTSRSTNGADEALNATAFAGDLTLPLSSVDLSEQGPTSFGVPGTSSKNAASTLRPIRAGILNHGVPRPAAKNADRKRVNFSKENQIREIEPRAPRPQKRGGRIESVSTSPESEGASRPRIQPPGLRVDTNALVDEMLLRIVSWNYSWIAEQQTIKDELPPLLQRISVNGTTYPELNALPVVSSFSNMEAYLGFFHPLMLHEMWAVICKENETIKSRILKVMVSYTTQEDLVWTRLHCSSLLVDGTFRLRELDLVVLAIPGGNKKDIKVFGVIDSVKVKKVVRTEEFDLDLLSTCPGRRPDLHLTFILRVKRGQRYESMFSENHRKIFSVGKVASLNTTIKQFCVNAELVLSPLRHVILRPDDHKDAFQLIHSQGGHSINTLNVRQAEAVRSIAETVLKTPDGVPKVALLQGPPGTGKTSVIVHLVIRMLYKYYGRFGKFPRILVCAPSNHAVDEIAYRLMCDRDQRAEKFDLLRIGVPTAIHNRVSKITLEYRCHMKHLDNVSRRHSPYSNELRTLEEEIESLSRKKHDFTNSIKTANANGNADAARLIGRKLEDLESQLERVARSLKDSRDRHNRHFEAERCDPKYKDEIISGAHVICSTLNSCRNKDMERVFLSQRVGGSEKTFLCCIVDEASQCTEPESLTPLAFGISKLVLIGDPEQLPATVTSQFAQSQRFDQSLFNRFFAYRISTDPGNLDSVQMLDTQYRMAKAICQWPSKFFYANKLLTPRDLQRSGPCSDYIVLNLLDGQEMLDPEDGKSICNLKEADVVAEAINVILQHPSTAHKTIGVITYYQKQKQCIIEAIRAKCRNGGSRVEVNTVDSFQGQEKDIIILSTVRARPLGANSDIGFVSSLQRMNVALTRAKESLFLIAHFITLETNEAWRDLIDDAKSRGVAHNLTVAVCLSVLRRCLIRPEASKASVL